MHRSSAGSGPFRWTAAAASTPESPGLLQK
jgi:hypothetical protein